MNDVDQLAGLIFFVQLPPDFHTSFASVEFARPLILLIRPYHDGIATRLGQVEQGLTNTAPSGIGGHIEAGDGGVSRHVQHRGPRAPVSAHAKLRVRRDRADTHPAGGRVDVSGASPRIVGVVLINEPKTEAYGGGDIAAPVFSRVMKNALRILNVPPRYPRDAV